MKFHRIAFLLLTVLFEKFLVDCQSPVYEEKYITVPVNHFSFENDKTFQLRYLINDTFTYGSPNTPILFFCGSEADIEFSAKTAGFVWELAPKINALAVFAEHRYYGKSLPFEGNLDEDKEKFAYLSIEQALADYTTLVEHLNAKATENRPVIAIGGSYGGIVAALFRIRNPSIVAGALASSAPLKQVSNLTACDEYSKTITNVYRTAYNEHCSSNIKRSWTALRDVAYEPGGVELFNEVFNFCEQWKDSSKVNWLLDKMDDVYWHMTMTNYPYEADVYTPLPDHPVQKFCSHLDSEFYGRDLVQAFWKALNVYTNPFGLKKCFDFPSRRVMQPYETSAWTFQRCTELLTGTCDRSDNSMFLDGGATFEQTISECRAMYGDRVDQDVNKINKHFEIDTLRTASKIIFSNGLLDPWSPASVLKPPNDQTVVINIPEGAHHIDLRFSNELDPPSVIQARKLEQVYLRRWIREFRRKTYHFM